MDFSELVKKQREFFRTGSTLTYSFRKDALKKLFKTVQEKTSDIENALLCDFNKSRFETYMSETGLVLSEIKFHLKHLASWMRVKRVRPSLAQIPAKSYIMPEPYGVSLIISPWNYPVLLCLEPLVGAISAGCTAILKPSGYTPHASAVIADIVTSCFPPEYVAVVEGGREENQALLEEPFDYIFFTGSTTVGRLVLEKASRFLTPVTLELGGKSPVIVDKTVDIEIAARRIAFGKILNAGQTCVAPDYLFVDSHVETEFIEAYKKAIMQFFPNGDMSSMTTIVNEKHFNRLLALLKEGTIVLGGHTDKKRFFIEPTILTDCASDSQVLQEEIFGPILPIIPYENIQTCIDWIVSRPKPLALYLFTKDAQIQRKVLTTCSFGGGCINDTVMHLASAYLPFGGVGASGMGAYHGKKSFETFTHYKSILKQGMTFDMPLRYRPITKCKEKLLRFFL